MTSRPRGVFVSLPVLNEAEHIEPLLDRIEDALVDEDYIVCVVDDGSRDGTRELLAGRKRSGPEHLHVIEQTKTRHGSQRGGALFVALVWGLDHTDCEIFVEMDGDLSHRPEELPDALRLLRSSGDDVIIASKFVEGSMVTNRPMGRRLVSQICSMAVHVFLSRAVRDYSNGYRFYTRPAAEAIRHTAIRYTSPIYLSEVLAVWLKQGFRIREISTLYVGRNEGLSKLRITDLAKAAIAVFEISFRYHIRGFALREIPARATSAAEGRAAAE